MPKPRLSLDQQTALKLRLERGQKTLEELAREFKVSSKTIGKYKKKLLPTNGHVKPMEAPALQLEKYGNKSLVELQTSNQTLSELVRQLSEENLTLRQRVIQSGIESAHHKS